jgi:DNA-binding response OmpR family regulator
MAQLRRKLEPDPSHPRHLITEPGIGYRFERGSAR